MSHPNEVNESVGGTYELTVGLCIEGVSGNDLAANRERALRTVSHQASHAMSALKERRHQVGPHVSGSTGDENPAGIRAFGKLFHLE